MVDVVGRMMASGEEVGDGRMSSARVAMVEVKRVG